MQGKYIFFALATLLLLVSPVSASLTKIAAGAPVFIGERDLDISSALQACHVIEWRPNGTPLTDPPAKNLTVISTVEESSVAFKYTIAPDLYANFTGMWYCGDTKPSRAVFDVREPQIRISVWDLDNDVDVTGITVPVTANITYRIDTNLDRALQYRYRPNVNPLDSFFTVTVTDPRGNTISNIYTGSYGNADTQIIALEKNPFISSSPYLWKNGQAWNRLSRNFQGDPIYPAGTYTFTVDQNLNGMQTSYADRSAEDRSGVLHAEATVTFVSVQATKTAGTPEPGSATPAETATAAGAIPAATAPPDSTATPVPARTTYASLPVWAPLCALGFAGLALLGRRE